MPPASNQPARTRFSARADCPSDALCSNVTFGPKNRSMFTPPTSDPRRRARIITGEIIAVGIMIIAAMWVMAGASIMAAREAAMDRTRSEGRNLAVAFAGEVTNILGGVNGAMEIIAQHSCAARGQLDIHDWAKRDPAVVERDDQGAIIGPDGKLVSTTLDPAPQPSTSATASMSAFISTAGSRAFSSVSR